MQRTLIAAAVLSFAWLGASHPAQASCDSYCDSKSELLGWSEDGQTIAVLESYSDLVEVSDRRGSFEVRVQSIAVYTDGILVAQFANLPTETMQDIGNSVVRLGHRNTRRRSAAERVDVTTARAFAEFKLLKPAAAWRRVFAEELGVRDGGLKQIAVAGQLEECETWKVVRLRRVIARFPKRCDDALVLGRARGGYVHPHVSSGLVKVSYRGERLTSWQRYELVSWK